MSLRIAFAALLFTLCAAAAYAQEGAAPAGGQNYTQRQFADHGFSLSLPNTGTLSRANEPGWDEENDEEVAFEWYGDQNTPVSLIQARVDDLGTDLDAETFRAFADALLANWAAPEGEGADTSPYEVLNTADNLVINGRTWNLIEVADRTDNETTVYYSVFSTYEGSRIYTVTLYYLEPVMEQVQEFGKPVLQGFSIL